MDSPNEKTAEIEALKRAYAALNRGDVDGFIADFDADLVRVEPPGLPTAQTLRGIEAFREHAVRARGTWAEGTCSPQRFVVAGDKVVVFCRVHVRLRDKPDWIDGEVTDVFTFQDAKVIDYRSFIDPQAALAFAGLADGSM